MFSDGPFYELFAHSLVFEEAVTAVRMRPLCRQMRVAVDGNEGAKAMGSDEKTFSLADQKHRQEQRYQYRIMQIPPVPTLLWITLECIIFLVIQFSFFERLSPSEMEGHPCRFEAIAIRLEAIALTRIPSLLLSLCLLRGFLLQKGILFPKSTPLWNILQNASQ